MNLHDYDIAIINSSGGKDSLCAIWEVCRLAAVQSYPIDRIVISHQDLGRMEWPGTKDLVEQQAKHFGLKVYYSKYKDKNGEEKTLLEYARKRRKWPSSQQRWCTSEYKRGPGGTVVTLLTKPFDECTVLYVFGFRADESTHRKKKKALTFNNRISTLKRKVYEWLPIHDWKKERVWATIYSHKLPYHGAYKLGMPRLSCVFCIFSTFDALVIAGRANPELLDEYIALEDEIGHTFNIKFSLRSVRDAIQNNYQTPELLADWIM